MAITEGLSNIEPRKPDGSGNNLARPDLGSAGSHLHNIVPPKYADGVGEPYHYANAREVSNAVVAEDGDEPNSAGVSNLFTFFGQFIDHDTDLTGGGSGETMSTTVPADDEVFEPGSTIETERSGYAEGTGENGEARQYENEITAWLDGSNIYGSDEFTANLLRANTADGGESAYLLTGADGGLPTIAEVIADNPGIAPADIMALVDNPSGDTSLFFAGDIRVNENVALSSQHEVWIKEHNHQVDRLREENPDWTEDQLYEAARVIVEAEYQNVVYNEWLPLLLGEENIPDYDGYDPSVDPSITSEFSTAAFRLGHSLLSSILERTNEDGSEADQGHLNLFQAFFKPSELDTEEDVAALIRGLAEGNAQELDNKIVDDVRNLLFGEEGDGSDLAVLNIMRGRDHGLGTLNDTREAMGLERHESFEDLTSDPVLAAALESVYGDVDNVDLWVGGLAEDTVPGSQLGETFHKVVLDQFMALRDGDRHYFETRLADNPELLEEILDTSYSDILLRNTDVEYLQDDVFVAHDRVGGTSENDALTGSDSHDLIIGFEGDDHVSGGEGDDDLYGGEGRDFLNGGAGDDVIDGEEGDGAINAGAGDDEIQGGSDGGVIYTGSGNDAATGGAGTDTVFADGNGAKVVEAGPGDDKIFKGVGEGDGNLSGGAGNDTITVADGANVINGGTGNDTIRVGKDADVVVFDENSGADRVERFDATEDLLDVSAYGFSSYEALSAAISGEGSDTLIELDAQSGSQVLLTGISPEQLNASNFILSDANLIA